MYKEIYPVTIINDRYIGCYSGALWTAWNKYEEDIPVGASSGDTECNEFWRNYTGLVGKGRTPDEALKDLEEKYFQQEEEEKKNDRP